MKSRKSIAIGAAIGLTFVSILVYFAPSVGSLQAPDNYSPTNTSWNGMSSFVAAEKPTILQNLTSLPRIGSGYVLFEVGPSTPFSNHESQEAATFVDGGGVLVLADDFGTGNSLLQGMGLNSRFSGSLLTDPLFNFQNSWLVTIPNVGMSNVPSLAFNYGTTLNVTDLGAQIIGHSSDFSYLYPKPGQSLASAPSGPFPVIAAIPIGKGEVILVSDSSVFINSMIGRNGNTAFLRDVSSGTVIFDTSHLIVGPATAVRNVELAVYSVLSAPEARYSLVLLGTAAILIYRPSKDANETQDELKEVLNEHPEWDAARLRALKEAMEESE